MKSGRVHSAIQTAVCDAWRRCVLKINSIRAFLFISSKLKRLKVFEIVGGLCTFVFVLFFSLNRARFDDLRAQLESFVRSDSDIKQKDEWFYVLARFNNIYKRKF